jgi:hypothetical protein
VAGSSSYNVFVLGYLTGEEVVFWQEKCFFLFQLKWPKKNQKKKYPIGSNLQGIKSL